MKFIPRDHKMARLWVECCSSSLSIEKAEAASIYANLCGFRTWDAIVQGIGSARPSIVDEDVDADTFAERKDFYMSVLVEVQAMNPYHASYLLDNLSPSSGKVPRRFSFDHLTMHDAPDENILNLFPPGMDMRAIEEGMQDFIEMLAKVNPAMAGVDTSNFMERMRISGEVSPADYCNFCVNMGWDIITDTYAEEYEHFKPMLCLNSSMGDVFVYANSLTKTPMDDNDEMADYVQEMVLKDAKESTDFPNIILFSGKFMSKDYKGNKFTCAGSLYSGGEWYDFLINRDMDTVEKLFEAAEADIDLNNPPECYADEGSATIGIFLALSNGLKSVDQVFDHKILKSGSASGWGALMLGDRK